MSDDQTKRPGLSLDSYSLGNRTPEDVAPLLAMSVRESEPAARAAAAAAPPDAAPTVPVRIILRGSGFLIRALDPTIMIGNVQLKDYEILPDESTIVGYLHEIPPEGSIISIEYAGEHAELPERFSLSKFTGDVD